MGTLSLRTSIFSRKNLRLRPADPASRRVTTCARGSSKERVKLRVDRRALTLGVRGRGIERVNGVTCPDPADFELTIRRLELSSLLSTSPKLEKRVSGVHHGQRGELRLVQLAGQQSPSRSGGLFQCGGSR